MAVCQLLPQLLCFCHFAADEMRAVSKRTVQMLCISACVTLCKFVQKRQRDEGPRKRAKPFWPMKDQLDNVSFDRAS